MEVSDIPAHLTKFFKKSGFRKILVIDDIREFPSSDNIVYIHAKTVREAAFLLSITTWDQVWFDHDLDGKDTIRPLICWIEEILPTIEEGIQIISANPVGRQYIKSALEKHYKIFKS